MRVVLYSPNFYPLTGGLEHVVRYLAEAFQRKGCRVTVICHTLGRQPDAFPFRVLRRAGLWREWVALRQADAILLFNISLKALPVVVLAGRPWVVSHQTPYGADGRGRLKRWVARRMAVRNICCSAHLATDLQVPQVVVVPNPYDEGTFRNAQPWVFRDRDVAFVGRLVSDKGVSVLLEALARLHAQGMRLHLTVVGDGPEAPALHQQCAALRLSKWVFFEGERRGDALAELLQRHRVLVVPSIWPEPFGIVALEGLACGCIVVASNTGGLPEALGSLGVLVPAGNAVALAEALARIWTQPFDYLPAPERVAAHLSAHTRDAIADRYLAVINEVAR